MLEMNLHTVAHEIETIIIRDLIKVRCKILNQIVGQGEGE
jgi:hypothetical protein